MVAWRSMDPTGPEFESAYIHIITVRGHRSFHILSEKWFTTLFFLTRSYGLWFKDHTEQDFSSSEGQKSLQVQCSRCRNSCLNSMKCVLSIKGKCNHRPGSKELHHRNCKEAQGEVREFDVFIYGLGSFAQLSMFLSFTLLLFLFCQHVSVSLVYFHVRSNF